MAFSSDFTMFDMTDPKLTKSADALEQALAQLSKNETSYVNSADSLLSVNVANGVSGFDEWLANDFQLAALSSDDSLSSSPFSALDDSPLLGLDSYCAMMGPSLFDIGLGFSAPASNITTPVLATPVAPIQAKPMLTSAAVKQAAAVLNIPYSHNLELAVLAQAARAAESPLPIVNSALAMVIPKIEPVEHTSFVPSYEVSQSIASNKRALTPEDDGNEVAAKRAKNTDAARRSRLKKLVRLETLETKVTELEATNNRLNMRVAILETEKNGHLSKEAEQSTRIAQLEAKLAEAHAALTSRV